MDAHIPFTLYKEDGDINSSAVIAVTLILAEIIALQIIYYNATTNVYNVAIKFA